MNENNLHNFDVKVETTYIPSESDPDSARFIFAYTITIMNKGDVPAQLLTRHWVITDSNGKVQEVKGEGVVGEQPYIKPGQGFQYTSGTMLETPFGVMQGTYQMVGENGDAFDAEVKPFTLATPQVLH